MITEIFLTPFTTLVAPPTMAPTTTNQWLVR